MVEQAGVCVGGGADHLSPYTEEAQGSMRCRPPNQPTNQPTNQLINQHIRTNHQPTTRPTTLSPPGLPTLRQHEAVREEQVRAGPHPVVVQYNLALWRVGRGEG